MSTCVFNSLWVTIPFISLLTVSTVTCGTLYSVEHTKYIELQGNFERYQQSMSRRCDNSDLEYSLEKEIKQQNKTILQLQKDLSICQQTQSNCSYYEEELQTCNQGREECEQKLQQYLDNMYNDLSNKLTQCETQLNECKSNQTECPTECPTNCSTDEQLKQQLQKCLQERDYEYQQHNAFIDECNQNISNCKSQIEFCNYLQEEEEQSINLQYCLNSLSGCWSLISQCDDSNNKIKSLEQEVTKLQSQLELTQSQLNSSQQSLYVLQANYDTLLIENNTCKINLEEQTEYATNNFTQLNICNNKFQELNISQDQCLKSLDTCTETQLKQKDQIKQLNENLNTQTNCDYHHIVYEIEIQTENENKKERRQFIIDPNYIHIINDTNIYSNDIELQFNPSGGKHGNLQTLFVSGTYDKIIMDNIQMDLDQNYDLITISNSRIENKKGNDHNCMSFFNNHLECDGYGLYGNNNYLAGRGSKYEIVFVEQQTTGDMCRITALKS